MKQLRLTLLLFLGLVASGPALFSQTITADADGEGMEVVIVNENDEQQTISVSAGDSYDVPEGFSLLSASGAGTITFADGGSALLGPDSAIAILFNSTIQHPGFRMTSGSATITTDGGSRVISAGTGAAFVAYSASTGKFSDSLPFPPDGFAPGVIPPRPGIPGTPGIPTGTTPGETGNPIAPVPPITPAPPAPPVSPS